ncbi:zinc metallopeptidase [Chamaesiphon sp. VAR_48_metabat_403]|uniref:zinc metallopeptidase n=1 Tax=Chamaesiphon sp. VAR_48_metabat_403 TaxID=2964700 RepID=UPI00286E61BD|nr:zinc metallopeptidase [Chamaesiphon sp. VAR_48_metabat_403]
MPRSNPTLKSTLLESNQTGMTSINLARSILRRSNRIDVKVCISEDEINCYSLFLNLVGLSEDVAYSQTVVAVTIAAHEVGHALQPQFEKRLVSLIGKTPILYLGRFSEYLILMCRILVFLRTLAKSGVESQIQNEYIQDPEIDFDRQYLNQSQPLDSHSERLRQRNYLVRAIGTILKWGIAVLNSLIVYTIFLFIIVLVIILTPISICSLFICRILILLTEIDASLRAMYILKHYKILDERQLKAARKFLIFAGLSYLRVGDVDRLFD